MLGSDRSILLRCSEHCGNFVESAHLFFQILQSPATREGLDAAHARGYPTLARDLEQADLTRMPDVRSPTQFHADSGYLDNSNHVIVLLAKQRHRSIANGIVVGARPDRKLVILPNVLAHDLLDSTPFILGHRRGVRKIEPQPIGGHKRSTLYYVSAQDVP